MYYDLKIRETKRFVIQFILFVLLVITIHFLISGTVSCVTYAGCLRSWCKIEWLNP